MFSHKKLLLILFFDTETNSQNSSRHNSGHGVHINLISFSGVIFESCIPHPFSKEKTNIRFHLIRATARILASDKHFLLVMMKA